MSSIRQWLHALLEGKRKGKGGEGYDEDEDMTGDAPEEEPDGAGWITDEDEEDWAKRLLGGHEGEVSGDASDDEAEWIDHDDIGEEAPGDASDDGGDWPGNDDIIICDS